MRPALDAAAASEAEAVYLVDSFGALYPEQVRDMTRMYLDAVKGTGKEVGFHAHNNQQLAFANTIEAIVNGANRLDATMAGIGRGAGNCPLELLIGFLHNPKFWIRPVLECVRDVFAPMRKDMAWGYDICYAITGQLNQHPRDAISWLKGDKPEDYVAFFDSITEEAS